MPDWEAVAAVLDAAPVCHLAFVKAGEPQLLPALHARLGTTLYFHGSPAGGVIAAATSGAPLVIGAVMLDGVAVARCACNSALNYRSVLCRGTGRAVEDPAEVETALRAITDRVTPGAWEGGRRPRPEEIAATSVVAVEVTACSVRVRSGPAEEDEADREGPGWSGVVPLHLQAGPAQADPGVAPGTPPPEVLPGALRR